MSLKALQDALDKAVKDEFDVGTVIRWWAADAYLYVAVKASDNRWCLLKMLQRSEGQ